MAVIFNTCSIKIRLFFVIFFPRLRRAGHVYIYFILCTPTNLGYLACFFPRHPTSRYLPTQFMLQERVAAESYRNAG